MDTLLIGGESSSSQFSYSPNWNYDVFLSFRGEDTRKTFTGHLYTRLCQVGINTFTDDEELRKGEVISRELEKAIEESRISIIVFSPNYPSSSWCLEELVKILECKHKLNQVVLPVFYHVDPSQVRKQTGSFAQALAMHQERSFGAQRMDKWTAALTEAANLSGWDLRNVADGHESKFIDNIIQQVLLEVKQIALDVALYPVGIDTRIKDVELLLQNECVNEVHMVGIWGVGGLGKTTLAKAIYNRMFRHFGGSCFLPNVRLGAEQYNGVVKLQEELLRQILNIKDFKVSSVSEGINLIKARLRSKKVLVVLDDVDHIRQLESLTRERSWFGSGSLIIITTRDKHLLCGVRASERYEAKLLDGNESQQLFCCHAFNNLSPPIEYLELVHEVIKYSGGLPLPLVTLGSHLRGRSVEEWRHEIKKVRAIPHIDIQKILKISFDGLDDEVQSVFLDIACAFHGFYEHQVIEILNACGFHTECAIATLVRKCLLQRNGMGCLVMHDLVRDMGREIVRLESPREPGRRSRLFNPQEVRDVLQGNKGSKKVEVLMVDPEALKGVHVSTKTFKKMKNLRVLKIDRLPIRGDLELLSKELRWLSWQKCPLKRISSYFLGERLVVLQMRGSNIQEFGASLQCCTSLKELDLSSCERLIGTPNFNGSRSLETLRLGGCSSLREIHQSIGDLDGLMVLDLTNCREFTDLPSSICHLKSLERLDISWCSSIQTLPVDLGNVQSLRYLHAHHTGIKQLPGSIEMLRYLLYLTVGGPIYDAGKISSQRRIHPIQSLSRRVDQIQSLSTSLLVLYLDYCDLSEADIPRGIGSLSSLESLILRGNTFRRLPFGFSELRSLRFLQLDDCENLQVLPSISNLEYLEYFSLANCKNLVKITEMDNLPSIKHVNMVNCSSLQNPFKESFFSAPALAAIHSNNKVLIKQEFEIYLQCIEIPDWCSSQVTASSIGFTIPTHNKDYEFLGMILWCVRKFVDGPSSSKFGCNISISGKMPLIFYWPYDFVNPGEHTEVELSCVQYRSCLQTPFEGQMKGGEKIQVAELYEEDTVKKMGIHLLYLDQHGEVTSLPAILDHSDHRMKRKIQETDGVSLERYPKRVSTGHMINSILELTLIRKTKFLKC